MKVRKVGTSSGMLATLSVLYDHRDDTLLKRAMSKTAMYVPRWAVGFPRGSPW